jgi:hypothetical protein
MLLIRENIGARGKAAPNSTMKPNWITVTKKPKQFQPIEKNPNFFGKWKTSYPFPCIHWSAPRMVPICIAGPRMSHSVAYLTAISLLFCECSEPLLYNSATKKLEKNPKFLIF